MSLPVLRHVRNPITGLYRFWVDKRGLDPLERMRMNRKPSRLPLPPEFDEYRAREYAEARDIAKRRTLHTLAQREDAIRRRYALRDVLAAPRLDMIAWANALLALPTTGEMK
ncbi:MAG TPA: hypothetical protein VFH85_07645 [Gammaproteobacteria bacterium]|nr:hypothetical protein [Gammaproteobacteria bacterium]